MALTGENCNIKIAILENNRSFSFSPLFILDNGQFEDIQINNNNKEYKPETKKRKRATDYGCLNNVNYNWKKKVDFVKTHNIEKDLRLLR